MANFNFKNRSDVNFDIVLSPKKPVNNFLDIVEQTYHAGFITCYSDLMVFGHGAERGTYNNFINLRMSGTYFQEAKNALTWFTNIFSTALRNKGFSNRKTHFYLSQRQEILPVLETFGLSIVLADAETEIAIHDEEHDLALELSQVGRIDNWQTRTKLITIPLSSKETEIMSAVATNILTPNNYAILQAENVANPYDFLQSVFIEGTRGLILSDSDINSLIDNRSILSRDRAA